MNHPIEQAVIFERATGRVLCSGTFQMLDRMITDTRGVLVGADAVPNEAYIDNGVVVMIPTAPSAYHVFNWVTRQWGANSERAWNSVKLERTRLLSDTDWRVVKALESEQILSLEWVEYRQALRDITLQADPWSIVWPVEPQA